MNLSNAYLTGECIKNTIPTRLDDPKLLPVRANATDAGADLRSTQDLVIYPGESALVDTGVAVKIPKGYVGLLEPRSSQRVRGITTNGTGVIDSDYRGNIKVYLQNTGGNEYAISKYDKIAQLLIVPVVLCDFVDSWNDTARGTGGFGSTGV